MLALASAAHPAGAADALPKRHAIAAANPLAAEAGLAMLRKGGGAVDAAVATQLVLGLVEPQSSGIGGGAFLLYFDAASRTVAAYDGRETAPASATPGMFQNQDGTPMKFLDAVIGGKSVGVPGVPRMLEAAHRRHGKLPWATLFEPAIRLAENGFAVSPRLHRMIEIASGLKTDPAAARYFYDRSGAALAAGAILKNPDYAATLRAIARGGADAFYTGKFAARIAETVQTAPRNPGGMTAVDLASYRAIRRDGLCRPYRVWIVCGMPPPSSGGLATLQILGMIGHVDIAALTPMDAPAVHLIAEASRLAFADRDVFAADPAFATVPVDGLLDRGYLAGRAALISPVRSLGRAAAGEPPMKKTLREFAPGDAPELPSTSHFSIVDADGDAVAMTSSVENIFGSRLMVGGFMLNNQLTDFSFVPERDGIPVANRIAPGKRPRSTMAPTIVLNADGKLHMTVGSPGGSRIVGFVVKTLVGALDWKMTMQQAIDAPNFVNRNGPTEIEAGSALERITPALRALGHEIRSEGLVSGLHGIRAAPDGLDGGADRRREGVVLGD